MQLKISASILTLISDRRTGRNGVLTIRTQDEPDSLADGASEGEASVLDFNHETRVFIGGIPKAFEVRARSPTG